MKGLIKDINIVRLFESNGIHVKLRVDEGHLWNETHLKSAYSSIAYTNASIDFNLEYEEGHGGEWRDLSTIIYWENKPFAIWPLRIAIRDGQSLLTSQGEYVLPPLFINDCPHVVQKRIVKSCLDITNSLAKELGLEFWDSSESFIDTKGLSHWHIESMTRDSVCSIKHELYLNLSPSLAEIKSGFRKSYKSLISSGAKLWSVGLLKTKDESIWQEFRELHRQVAGRITRSENTWKLQLQEIDLQQAFLVYLRNADGRMVGGGFFNVSRDEGLYAVAAHDRSLFDKPLGHVIQYVAIQELKAHNVHWYKIGLRPYRADLPTPGEKELAIGYFKEGFGAQLFPRYILRHPTT